ncbi:unnamed protein product [Arabis nemorensis]|uniref:RING-type domain-containing protein n=1 Tax=Arabis nemorensis TaxID=586526 RepID=A0A565CRV8_9BRAS|nr:unnamed protein product [Arabis nemorensis]
MDSKETEDIESLTKKRDALLTIQQRIEKAKASGSTASISPDLQNLSKEIQQVLMMTTANPSNATLRITDELDKVFVAEEVGHSCDLCLRDLATDPERPNGSLISLQESCVLACGHVYHFKCLRGTTLDLDNSSKNPSCIFCISSSN